MMRIPTVFILLCMVGSGTRVSIAQTPTAAIDVFRSQVRETPPLSPQEEQAKLKVPAGFRVTLFASEPQLQKPLNMAFDADGRLWVTGSNEYPYPADEGAGQDSVRILEDTDGDGAADKVTVFADNLNIPIGIYPYRDGAIVFSIPNILFLRDTNGDGKADKREVLYGPFDTSRDTHGMNNAFRRGFDGWLYCCHGFNNQSTVAGTDGHEATMQSGNTYRIRLDGSRIEHFSHGQVNPFGMTIDANGDLFTSDCHTKPVTLLMRDGYYESFGKAHDGLGFVPPVMEHLHGSTAIDGLCQYQGTAFPPEYHDDIFVGNVMTCRVHRNSIVRNGSSVSMREEEDFLTSEDPWFRPVDIQVGPDGALYVADFYNRIIGHYEVPLDHPGRDRKRGRIWKVTYTRDAARDVAPKLSSATLPNLIAATGNRSKPIRQHAADQIVDRIGASAIESIESALPSGLQAAEQLAVPQLLWSLHRLNSLKHSTLQDCYLNGNQRTRVHVMRICSETTATDPVTLLIRSGLRDPSALVRRVAADAAARHPSVELFKEVVNATATLQGEDVHQKHALRIALRNQLLDSDVAKWFVSLKQPQASEAAVSDVLPGLRCKHSGDVAVALLRNGDPEADWRQAVFRHAATTVSSASIAELTELAQQTPDSELPFEMEIWVTLSNTIREQGIDPPSVFSEWSAQLGESVFETFESQEVYWGQYQLRNQPAVKWDFEPRRASAKVSTKTPFLSSLPGGERGVGVLRSRSFLVPFSLELEVCGHLGPPGKPALPDSRIVLRDFDTGKELASVLPPRSDIAKRVKWDLKRFLGTKAYLEIIDGVNLPAYAWLGLGRVSPRVVRTSDFDGGQSSTMLASAIKFLLSRQQSGVPLTKTETQKLLNIVGTIQIDGPTRTLAARGLIRHRQRSFMEGTASLLSTASTPRIVDVAIVEYCASPISSAANSNATEVDTANELKLLRTIFGQLNRSLRNQLAASLSENQDGAALLLDCIDAGVPTAQLLRDNRLAQQISAYGEEFSARVKAFKSALPDESAATAALSKSITRRLRLGQGDADSGKAIFGKHCIACHRRGGEGSLIGPQLDGIGARGTSRLLEDILRPNQNVDIAFRTSVLAMKDGRIVSGLVRQTQDVEILDVIDTRGTKKTIARKDIEDRTDSAVSLMPGNVEKLLSEDDLLNLVRWLSK